MMGIKKLPQPKKTSNARCIALVKRGDYVIANKGKVACDKGYRAPAGGIVEYYPAKTQKMSVNFTDAEWDEAHAMNKVANPDTPPTPPKDPLQETLEEIENQELMGVARPQNHRDALKFIKDNELANEGESYMLSAERVAEILDAYFGKEGVNNEE